MHTEALGSAGLGLVWGWLVGRLDWPLHRQGPRVFALLGATLLLAGQVLVLAGWLALLLYFTAAWLGGLLHLRWRHDLRVRFAPPADQREQDGLLA